MLVPCRFEAWYKTNIAAHQFIIAYFLSIKLGSMTSYVQIQMLLKACNASNVSNIRMHHIQQLCEFVIMLVNDLKMCLEGVQCINPGTETTIKKQHAVYPYLNAKQGLGRNLSFTSHTVHRPAVSKSPTG